ncbi:MAG: hypothetical protein HYZ75_16815 [Elusimicrobia bacterium]|nr:hypothetical protein [Elusimicrobiota bacterium]
MPGWLLASFLLLPAQAGVEAGGSLKTLYSYSRSPLTGREHWLDLNRARLSLKGEAWGLKASVDYDHELRFGSQLRSLESRLFGLAEPASFLDMDQTISSGTDAGWRHRLYRGWVEAAALGWTLRFGRQRVAWGTGKIWNPVDVLNPYLPTALERDQRLGVDALHLRRGLGDLGQAEGVWALGRSWVETDVLTRVKGNYRGADAALLGGKVAGSTGSWLAGGELAWDLGGGSLHGEWTYTDLETRTPFWRALVGYEYSLSNARSAALRDLWFNVELFQNGRGATDPSRYDVNLLRSGREVALARTYLGTALKKDLHPLVVVELALLQNLNDQSRFLSPSISWNAWRELHLSGGWQHFGGRQRSEFGRLPNLAFLQAQYFF